MDKKPEAQVPFAPYMGFESWKKLTEEQIARMKSLHDEIARYEGASTERARMAIDEGARILKDSITYTSKLYAGWREQALDTARAAATVLTK